MRAMEWRDRRLYLLDQLLLPGESKWIACDSTEDVASAIEKMQVRGAPAIGTAAAYGVVLAAQEDGASRQSLYDACNRLEKTRPTAVNLFWALDRMRAAIERVNVEKGDPVDLLLEEANEIARLDIEVNRSIGKYGAELVPLGAQILTHCNTGSLATVEYGTALGVIRAAHEAGKQVTVKACETRPYLQGARLTSFELKEEGIPVAVITDSMAGYFMGQKQVDLIVVGADRVTANGDVANKIGTYSLAVLANYHKIPFYVAAPFSTFDLKLASGADIEIEQRNPREVAEIMGVRILPEGVEALHPAFDVTPHQLITGIITEHGVIQNPTAASVKAFFDDKKTELSLP